MSILKLAVYGGLGYLAYQMFFAELEPSQQKPQGKSGKPSVPQRGQQSRQGQQGGGSPRGQQLTGGGEGVNVVTSASGGASTTHRVGRGVR